MKTIVFGLDRVLLARVADDTAPCDFEVTEKSEAGLLLTSSFVFRPGLRALLSGLSRWFEIVVFSRDAAQLTNQLVQKIDPDNELVACVLDKRHCVYAAGGALTKDLRVLLNRPLAQLVLVDTEPPVPASADVAFHHVSPFSGSRSDSFLPALQALIEQSCEHND